jgi:hypothetical protein
MAELSGVRIALVTACPLTFDIELICVVLPCLRDQTYPIGTHPV